MGEDKIWQTVLGEVEIVLPKMQFATWFKGTSLELSSDGVAIVLVNNSFCRDWISNKYKNILLKAIRKAEPNIKDLEIKIRKIEPMERLRLEVTSGPNAKIEESKAALPYTPNGLKSDYTFDTFVVGNSNSLAYAVAQEVASGPGAHHNPLFIYGGVGLGKTHLAQAIGQEIRQKKPAAKIVYVSCETFTNDFINAIARKKMNQFKKNYREIDVLIVDDIQFLSSKEGSQEEFFHTFNSLQQGSRQIVLTADRVPQAIPALERRLVSRFGSGMVVDIQPPNFETRVAIISEKCKEKNYIISDEVTEYLAKNISSNIRELEGALHRLHTYCHFNQITPTTHLAAEILRDVITSSNKTIGTAEIIEAVCHYFSLSKDELTEKSRKQEFILPRQIAIYLIREQTNKSLPEIGKILGGKDHTTIMYSEKKISQAMKVDAKIKSDVEKIRDSLFTIKN